MTESIMTTRRDVLAMLSAVGIAGLGPVRSPKYLI